MCVGDKHSSLFDGRKKDVNSNKGYVTIRIGVKIYFFTDVGLK
jgi:hypothetical protein